MPESLDIGLILFPDFQWLDAAGTVDLLNNHSHGFLSEAGIPKETLRRAPIINWHYISSDLEEVNASSGPPLRPTTTIETCPPLDYIIVPGPKLDLKLSEAWINFFRQRYEDPNLRGILLVCTASLAVSQTGILDGLNVCSNKIALRSFAEKGLINKKVKWVKDRRWIVDGKVWSSAGITAGLDLAAAFARAHIHKEVIEVALEISEYTPLPDKPDVFAYILDGIDVS